MLSKPCTSPQPHLSIFLQSEKKSQLDTWCGNLPAKWLRLSRSIFGGLFQMEKIRHLSVCTTKTNSLGTVSLKKRRKLNVFGTEQSEKQFRSLLGDLNQTKLEETISCIFLWDNFLVLLSTQNSEHSQGNWMLQTGSKQIVPNDTVSTQIQRQDPLWRPFLPLQRGQCVLLSQGPNCIAEGWCPLFTAQSPHFEGWR